jgi:hypothetical protein
MRLLAFRAETMQGIRRLKLPCDDITPIGLWGSDMYLIGVNNEQFEVLRAWNVQTEDVTPATLRDLHTESAAIPTSPSAGNTASGARSSARGASSAAPSAPSAAATEPASASPSDAPVAPAPAARSSGVKSAAAAERAVVVRDRDPEQDMPDPSAARGESTLDLQPAFAAVAAPPAPEAPSASATIARPGAEGRARNGSAGTPSVTATSSEDRGGADLKLEPSSPRSETKSSRASRDTEAKAAKESPKDTAKDSGGSNAGKLRMTVDGEHLYAEIKGGKIVLKDRTYDSLAHARDSIRRERNKVAVWEYFDEGVKAWRVLNRD